MIMSKTTTNTTTTTTTITIANTITITIISKGGSLPFPMAPGHTNESLPIQNLRGSIWGGK